MSYVTKQAILEESGLYQRVTGDSLVGSIDGANKVFTTTQQPLIDTNYDDDVDSSDVIVYVNGTAVSVGAVNADTGTITLGAAPALNTVVTAAYRTSAIPDDLLEQYREEAQSLIDEAMDSVDPTPYDDPSLYPDGVPPTVRKMARFYAAGLLLIRDYGFNRDNQGTSKDGAMKLSFVEGTGLPGEKGYKAGWLAKYVAIGGATGASAESDDSQVISEPGLFGQFDHTTQKYTTDELFMLGPDLEDDIR